jgi:hypothetical protein
VNVTLVKYIPVDVGRLTGLLCLVAPEVKSDPNTGEVKKDRDGRTKYVVGIAVRDPGSRKAVVIDVTTVVEPHGITEGTRVRMVELVASQWEMAGRSGLSWEAAEILPDNAPPVGGGMSAASKAALKGGEA